MLLFSLCGKGCSAGRGEHTYLREHSQIWPDIQGFCSRNLGSHPAPNRTVKLLWYYSGRLYHCIIKLSEPIECTTASSVQSLSRVQLFVTLRTAAHQASLSITNSWSPHKPTSIESMTPSSHLILCCLLLLLPPTPPSIRVFSNESALGIRWPNKALEFQLQHQAFQ